nr:immunoglobulin heavy chain junction region [Macaca mulatta]MOV40753.1 immunoglobulin heavy chain junction region [Macaca mulatta]
CARPSPGYVGGFFPFDFW